MFAVFFLILAIPAALVVGGIMAFVILPVKAGIAVAALAFLIAAGVFTWLTNNIDLSH